jgi:hypothetical protein
MQTVSTEHALPMPLTCSGCRHWGAVTARAESESAGTGRCGRFGEIRPGAARPRCNICWEPAAIAQPLSDRTMADD